VFKLHESLIGGVLLQLQTMGEGGFGFF